LQGAIDADTTGAEARLDGRITAATGCRSYSPLEGAPGSRRDTQFPYSRTGTAPQGFRARTIHYES